MLRFYEFWGLAVLALDIYCVIDIIQSRDDEVRNLPKIAWLLLVLFFPMVGSIAWLAAGRPDRYAGARSPYERSAPTYPEYDRPGRAAGTSSESDDEFLAKVRERAEEQRRTYRAQQLERERQERGEPGSDDSGLCRFARGAARFLGLPRRCPAFTRAWVQWAVATSAT